MLADPLTKGLPPSIFREHVAGMGLLTYDSGIKGPLKEPLLLKKMLSILK
jgi:hypothetical protein